LYSDAEDAMSSIVGASISYRMAFGPNAGKKTLTLQTLPATFESGNNNEQASQRGGFSLHAGVACKAGQRKKIVPKQAIQVEAEHSAKCQIGSKRYGMHWAQRLKRVFNIDVTTCDQCGGKVKAILY
jgi:hypothetical protein